ncbi:MAG TPA: TetR/AcrR family transcriptional regulator [Candidatus Sabulitectum sp.]|nr:TetR/AcrR family transcriptional regulator [Candidatus Sabulitectum sp.]HPR21165.1 TetR/AcrR family transcriptional regulator [Candidatus Sabulitectum sp.]
MKGSFMGLRERKRRDTRKAILDSAEILFPLRGYRNTTMEAIAERAEIAVGTIYNYFHSKAEVMVELNSRETERVISELRTLDIEGCSVEDMLWEIISRILAVFDRYPRELMRELFSATIENSHSTLTNGLVRQDEKFLGYLAGILEELKSKGRLKMETDPGSVAYGIYSLVFGGMLRYSMDDDFTLEDAMTLIAGMIGQFCRGIVQEGV